MCEIQKVRARKCAAAAVSIASINAANTIHCPHRSIDCLIDLCRLQCFGLVSAVADTS